MPGRKTRKGNPELSRQRELLGMCNEHGPTPEGMMCSALHGNMKRLAEMTNPQAIACVTTWMIRLIGWAGSCEPHAKATLH